MDDGVVECVGGPRVADGTCGPRPRKEPHVVPRKRACVHAPGRDQRSTPCTAPEGMMNPRKEMNHIAVHGTGSKHAPPAHR